MQVLVKVDPVAVPLCKQQFLSFHCDLEAGHEGLHHDGTTRPLGQTYWPPKKPSKSEIEREDSANCVRNVR